LTLILAPHTLALLFKLTPNEVTLEIGHLTFVISLSVFITG